MSGIEAVGLAAAILQLGGMGAELSKALYKFMRTATSAEAEIENLANDIDLTCAALESVNDALQTKHKTSIATETARLRAARTITSCRAIFVEISKFIHGTRKRRQDGTLYTTVAGKINWPFNKTEILELSRRLESRKLSLSLLLHVLQLRRGTLHGYVLFLFSLSDLF